MKTNKLTIRPFWNVGLILISGTMISLSPLEAASVRQARKAFERGSFETALNQYKELLEEKPDDHRLHYNAGIAAYRAGRPAVAAEHFSRVTMSPDLASQQPAYYNLGNALYQIGAQADTPEQKMEAWQNAVKSFEGAVKLSDLDEDAKHNLDIVKKLLEELQQEQQQQQQQDDQSNDQSNDQEENEEEDENENNSEGDENEQNEQQDSSSDENESEDQNQNDSSSEEEQSDEQQQPQSSQDENEGEQPEEQQPQNQPQQQDPSQQGEDGDDDPNSDSQAQALPAGQMTEEEAKQLLESLKDDEQTIVFLPEKKKQSKANSGKDW